MPNESCCARSISRCSMCCLARWASYFLLSSVRAIARSASMTSHIWNMCSCWARELMTPRMSLSTRASSPQICASEDEVVMDIWPGICRPRSFHFCASSMASAGIPYAVSMPMTSGANDCSSAVTSGISKSIGHVYSGAKISRVSRDALAHLARPDS